MSNDDNVHNTKQRLDLSRRIKEAFVHAEDAKSKDDWAAFHDYARVYHQLASEYDDLYGGDVRATYENGTYA